LSNDHAGKKLGNSLSHRRKLAWWGVRSRAGEEEKLMLDAAQKRIELRDKKCKKA
jgi:hypothetical protein